MESNWSCCSCCFISILCSIQILHTILLSQYDSQYLIICPNRLSIAAQSLADMHSDSVDVGKLNTEVIMVEDISEDASGIEIGAELELYLNKVQFHQKRMENSESVSENIVRSLQIVMLCPEHSGNTSRMLEELCQTFSGCPNQSLCCRIQRTACLPQARRRFQPQQPPADDHRPAAR